MRLLKSTNLKSDTHSNLLQFVEEHLAFRRSTTVILMKSLQEAIASQKARSEYLSVALNGQKSNEGKENENFGPFPLLFALHPKYSYQSPICSNIFLDVIVALQNHNDHLKEVVDNASQAISIISEKHKRYLDEIETFKSNHSVELQEIKRLSGAENILPHFPTYCLLNEYSFLLI